MLLKNCCIENGDKNLDILILEGKIAEISDHIECENCESVLDLNGKLVLPPFVESHIHLDTAYSLKNEKSSVYGTLFDGISNWASIKNNMSEEAIYNNAYNAVVQEMKMGVQSIRTHVDITAENLQTLSAISKLKQDFKDIVDIQIIAFPQDGLMSCDGAIDRLHRAIEIGVDGLGAIPHFEYTHEYAVESLNYIMKIAAEKGLLVDVHCDETDDSSSRGLETLVARAIEYSLFDRVTASHTTAMHSYDNAYVARKMQHIQKSRINFVANPLVNVCLQGKNDSYPKRRGMTRVKELTEAGLNVSFGHDDIMDPWYSMGNGNMMDVAYMGLHLAHMVDKAEVSKSYKFITYNGAKTLNISDSYGIKVGNPANLIVLNAIDFYDAMVNKASVLYSIRNGKMIVSSIPTTYELHFQI